MSWEEFWRLVYRPAAEAGETPEDGEDVLSAADTCMELYLRLAPDPGEPDCSRKLPLKREDAIAALEAKEWPSVAEDLRHGVATEKVLNTLREIGEEGSDAFEIVSRIEESRHS